MYWFFRARMVSHSIPKQETGPADHSTLDQCPLQENPLRRDKPIFGMDNETDLSFNGRRRKVAEIDCFTCARRTVPPASIEDARPSRDCTIAHPWGRRVGYASNLLSTRAPEKEAGPICERASVRRQHESTQPHDAEQAGIVSQRLRPGCQSSGYRLEARLWLSHPHAALARGQARSGSGRED